MLIKRAGSSRRGLVVTSEWIKRLEHECNTFGCSCLLFRRSDRIALEQSTAENYGGGGSMSEVQWLSYFGQRDGWAKALGRSACKASTFDLTVWSTA